MNTHMINPLLFQIVTGLFQFLLILGGAFFLLWYYLKHTRKPLPAAGVNPDHATILALRLQACERFVLFLERIHPSNLLLRMNGPELSAAQLQSLLVRTIREEFEYNLSQQLYVSNSSWELIKNAKEETISLINHASSGIPEQGPSADLVKKIFDVSISRGRLPVETALDEIKREIQKHF